MARRKSLLLLGAAVVAAGVLLKRDKVAGMLPGRGQTYEPPTPHTPGPSNYDAPGPVANTATPVPAPEPLQPPAIDEDAEEAAAAAEAANIGGVVSDYAGPADLPADEAERPVAEAGGGEAEGQEQAEAELRSAAEPADGMSDEQRQIEDTIEEAANPAAGERVEPVAPTEEPGPDEDEQPTQAWSPPVPERTDDPAPFEEPAESQGEQTQFEPPKPAEGDEKKDEDGGSDWRTWSGRSVNP